MKMIQALEGFIAALRNRDDEDNAQIIHLLNRLENHMTAMDDKITELTASVASMTSAEQSAIALIQGLPALIQTAVDQATAAGATPAQLTALTDLKTAIDTKSAELAAAVTAGTTPPPPPPPQPVTGTNQPGGIVPNPLPPTV